MPVFFKAAACQCRFILKQKGCLFTFALLLAWVLINFVGNVLTFQGMDAAEMYQPMKLLLLSYNRINYNADFTLLLVQLYPFLVACPATFSLVKERQTGQEVGMIVDVSHCNEKTFWDVVEMSSQPILATHSCARALSDTPRNLSDEQIRAIGRLGGVIGVNGASLVARFKDPRNASPADLAAHMMYEKNLAGAGVLGIGLDQCDRLNSPTMQLEAFRDVFDIIPTHDGLEKLAAALLDQGLSEDELAGALGGNTLRVFEKVLG